MANFNFNLKESKSLTPTPINLIVRYSKNKVVFYTRESILPTNWDKDTQRAKPGKELPEFNRENSS